MSRSHSFSVDVAEQYSVDIALMLNHFSFWYLKNKGDNHQYFKGDYWVRMKAVQMQEYYPYFSLRQLRYLIDKMIDLKLLKQDEFNTKKNDRTKWYSLTKKSKSLLNISTDKIVTNNKKIGKKTPYETAQKLTDKNVTNVTHKIVSQTDKNVTSILKEEDTKDRYYYNSKKIASNISLIEIIAMQQKVKIEVVKSKIKEFELHCRSLGKNYNNDSDVFNHFGSWFRKFDFKSENLEKELEWFINVFNQISKRDFKITDTVRTRFAQQFAVGYSGADMRKAIANLYSSAVGNKFHINNQFKFATPEYLLKGENLNKYLNFKVA